MGTVGARVNVRASPMRHHMIHGGVSTNGPQGHHSQLRDVHKHHLRARVRYGVRVSGDVMDGSRLGVSIRPRVQ